MSENVRVFNALSIVAIIVITIWMAIRYFLKDYIDEEDDTIVLSDFDIENLTNQVKVAIRNSLKERVEDMHLNRSETEKLKKNKSRLRKAVREAPTGDSGQKEYVKDYISNLLQTKFGINELTIDQVVPFSHPEKLGPNDRFRIVLYWYIKKYKLHALEHLVIDNGFHLLRNDCFEITEDDIRCVYNEKIERLKYSDKLKIVCQKIYSKFIGQGIADDIRDMVVDGVSFGVSGISEEMFNYTEEYIDEVTASTGSMFSHDSIWIFFQGKSIHMSCIGFRSQKEFERVCTNIYQYNNPGQLSENKGYITNELKDGSRVIVVRPPFSDSWAAILRKHSNGRVISVDKFITDKNCEIPKYILKSIVKGCQVLAFTGSQGCGKTTLMRGTIAFLPRTYNLRIQELIFELALRTVFGKRNIVTFKETPNISGQEGLDLQKKTDGDVNILGEVASSLVANWVIQMSQVASLMTMFSHHAKTVQALITWMRDALLKDGGLNSEYAAEEEVVHCLNFDIHLNVIRHGKDYGHRYIERITQIVPLKGEDKLYKAVDIVVFDKRKRSYHLVNRISKETMEEMFDYFEDSEIEEFEQFYQKWMEDREVA